MFRIVETDNYDRDYPDEKFVNLPPMLEKDAVAVAAAINLSFPGNHPRYWKVVPDNYVLSPAFEP